MKKRRKHKQSQPGKHQRGSALILVLGVLALLLISATTFIFTANTERDAASVNADVTKARLMAKAGLGHAEARLINWGTIRGDGSPTHPYQMYYGQNEFSTGLWPSSNWRFFGYSPCISQTPVNNSFADAFHLNIGFDYTPKNTSGMSYFFLSNMSWLLYHQDNDATKPLVGRVTYLIVDESQKLDINSTLTFEEPYYDKNGDGFYQLGEFFIDINGNGVYDASAVDEGDERNSSGSSAQFIDLQNEGFVNNGPAPWYSYDWTTLITGGDVNNFRELLKNNKNKKWLSWQQMYAADYDGVPLFVKPPPDYDALEMLKNTFYTRSYDKEAYSALDGGGNRQDFNRFSFSRFDWDSTDWDSNAAPDSDAVRVAYIQGTARREIWDDTDGNYTRSIPWLANLMATTARPHTSLRNQVAANIIDYCDSDSRATHDYAAPTVSGTRGTATYCGLEKVPYINEVSFEFNYMTYDTSDPVDGVADEGELTVIAYVELVNMYRNPLTIDESDVKVNATMDIEQDDGSNTTASQDLEFTATSNSVSVPARSYYTVALTLTTPAQIKLTGGGAHVASFDNLKITGLDVVFGDPGNPTTPYLYDCAVISTGTSNSVTLVGGVGTGDNAYASVDVNDPRCNTDTSQWAWAQDGSSLELCAAAVGSIGLKNPNSVPSAGDDLEQATHPADPANPISTAYIRNAPMQSLWELGAIHRGEPWRTISLLNYNENPATATYANGDAILLDQCTIGWTKVAYGRLNMNNWWLWSFYPVLRTVNLGAGYDYKNSGAFIPDSIMLNITRPIRDFTEVMVPGKPRKWSRALLANSSDANLVKLQDGTGGTQNTNATQEEIIGRIAGLLTARTNYFTIIVTAQTVKDLKDLGGAPDTMTTRPASWTKLTTDHWIDVQAEVKMVATVRRDAFTNKFTIEDIRYVE